MKGSVITPMNWFIAPKVVCCEPVAASPEACDKPFAFNAANTIGMPPVVLKKLIRALAALFWLPLRVFAAGVEKLRSRFR